MPTSTRNTARSDSIRGRTRAVREELTVDPEPGDDEDIELTAEQLSAFGYTTEQFESMGFTNAQVAAIMTIATNMKGLDEQESPTSLRQKEFDLMFADPTQRIIPGYNNDKPITRLENTFRFMLMELGLNRATADEMFRHGYSSLSDFEGLDSNGIKGIVSSVNKYKHSKCPNPDDVFVGRNFAEKLKVVVSWVEFMPTIGHVISPSMWSEIIEKWIKDRMKSIKEDDDLEANTELTLPDPLSSMSNFRKFDDQLREYLRHRRGVTKSPLLYLLREGSEVEVTDYHTGGDIGDEEDDMYPDWAAYHIRCTVHKGSHYKKDNNILWGILFKLKRSFIKTSSFSGHSQRYTFEKHKQKWFEAKETLKRYGRHVCEEEFVMDFCNSISDPRLDNGIAVVLSEGSPYINDFEKTAAYLSQTLGIKEMVANRKRSSTRNVAAYQGNGGRGGRGNQGGRRGQSGRGGRGSQQSKSSYTGPIKAQYYDHATWKSMSKEQKAQVLQLKKERDNAKSQKRSLSSVSADKPTTPAKKKKSAGDQFGSKAHQESNGNDSE